MKFLITGCAGFIGSSLTKKLLSEGHKVFGVDNLSNDEHSAILKLKRIEELKIYNNFNFIKLDIVNDSFNSILKE